MPNLTVLSFPDAGAADRALDLLHGMEREHLLRVNDAVTVSWPATEYAPRTRQSANLPVVGALDGAFWGMLAGLLFAAPFLGAAAGAALGALAGRFADFGIDDRMVAWLRERIEPGSSALFLLTEDGAGAEIVERLGAAGMSPDVLETDIAGGHAAELRKVFGRS